LFLSFEKISYILFRNAFLLFFFLSSQHILQSQQLLLQAFTLSFTSFKFNPEPFSKTKTKFSNFSESLSLSFHRLRPNHLQDLPPPMQGDLLNIDQNNNSLSNSNNNLNNPMTQRSRTASQEASNHSSFYPASVHQQSPPPHQQSNSTFKENRNSWVGGAELEIYPHDDPHQVYASSSHDYSSSSNSHGSDYDPDFSSNESLIREYAINAGGWDVGDKRASFSGSNEDEGYYSNQNSGSVRSGKAVSRPRTKSSLFWKRKQVFFTICSNP